MIARFEAIAEAVVEGTFARLFTDAYSTRGEPAPARAMEDHQVVTLRAFTRRRSILDSRHPTPWQRLLPSARRWRGSWPTTWRSWRSGWPVPHHTLVRYWPRRLEPHQSKIEAHGISDRQPKGEDARDDANGTRKRRLRHTPGALLIPGRTSRHVNLTQPVISIVTSIESDLVIEEFARFPGNMPSFAADTSATCYTTSGAAEHRINVTPIEECVLHSGDVISLGGVEIVYR